MSTIPTYKTKIQTEAIIGRNIRPGMRPGGFSEVFGERSREPKAVGRYVGFQDVSSAASATLDRIAQDAALREDVR